MTVSGGDSNHLGPNTSVQGHCVCAHTDARGGRRKQYQATPASPTVHHPTPDSLATTIPGLARQRGS